MYLWMVLLTAVRHDLLVSRAACLSTLPRWETTHQSSSSGRGQAELHAAMSLTTGANPASWAGAQIANNNAVPVLQGSRDKHLSTQDGRSQLPVGAAVQSLLRVVSSASLLNLMACCKACTHGCNKGIKT